MIFSVRKTRKFLLEEGHVLTVRKKNYKEKDVWIRASRLGPKIAEGIRYKVKKIESEEGLKKICKLFWKDRESAKEKI